LRADFFFVADHDDHEIIGMNKINRRFFYPFRSNRRDVAAKFFQIIIAEAI
jgi:hypothetical protein